MITRPTTLGLIALGGLALATGRAPAQVGINPYAGLPNYNAPAIRPYAAMPGLSPYLNIYGGRNNTGGNRLNNAAINYYNFTLPALQAQNPLAGYYANSAIQQQFAATQGAPGDEVFIDPADPTSVKPRPAGSHPTVFFNTGGYFNSLGTIGSARPQAAGARPQQQQPAQQRR